MNQNPLNEEDALEALYNGIQISKLPIEDTVKEKYNASCDDLYLPYL
jgi:hypothetical protein